ncbi:SWI/SNF-related matrix-associated actin-dependent regulator of chromatin subfamily A containing DEAD/H box 1 homolog [Chelonus insularis]|uniref:SWI/SNF-related matrix-associated actin-dependent regulator of chromatin subfamily A containing DEAD/H box 1 homolog n=1 Tax=Chelonus insularis TaxID=460826 RepID=UPI0015885414|nr:SWI/SNF-related matrix-associated actin-dependent regulator of chromatin subfamily A containing DEAD/H box 1 homolog [Chelonus insularis]XP_034946492.1 SWI/SNF-related matrix-associated actin-dependent regulator of chromatin subfamily A containing DEAD/H box 1 homolog [Chelonus insularis]XP_034946493.1 SWI/SNF-related matrix-associated actin-dependent regulator of chromatin subfamily A containing DEAD/H box 1 homolog [Chelonus insularis]XP_034946494.1 SWI/SNF-related matrix-associated actin-d
MSDSNLDKQDTLSPNLSNNLRRFRFQKKPIEKLKMSDDDSNLVGSDTQIRRKVVNRIEDSDSDVGSPIKLKTSDSDGDETKEKDRKLQYLIKLHPNHDTDKIQEILNNTNWDLDLAKNKLQNNKKRPLKSSHKSKNKKPRKDYDDDDDGDADSDEATYKNKVFDSDEDSDVEISNELTGDKKAVLNFMQTAMMSELLLMSQCSQKKAQAIIDSRPFEDWRDLIEKFQHTKYLDTELLNSAQVLLATRSAVDSLMKKCLRLSANMEKAVAAGASMIKEQPKALASGLKLAPYQMVGLNWLAVMHSQNVNGILADEMGLGKTVQVIAFLTYLKEAQLIGENDGPHLIVVPSSTIENWSNELERWSPNLKAVQYYGSQEERKDIRMGWRNGDLDDVDVILTTYNLVSSTPEERKLFRIMPITYVIFDEAHMLKNMGTVRYTNLVRINAKHRILLTGTPLQNNLLELMSLLIFVMPSLFAGKQNDLKSLFSKTPKLAGDNRDKPLFEQEQVKNAKLIMKPFFLRRLKSQVLKDLPIKTEKIIKCSLVKKQREMYKQLMVQFSEANYSEDSGVSMMMKLRKLANHPLLMRDYYDEEKVHAMAKKLSKDPSYKQKNSQYIFEELVLLSDYQLNQLTRVHKCLAGQGLPQELIPISGKLKTLDELLPQLKEDEHRVLIFSQFTMMLDILEEYLTIRGYTFYRLDGQTPVIERQALIDEFTQDSSIFIFLLSTKAGGLGINLTAADTVIIHDIDFNPYNDKQAEDRCHRVGQTQPVSIVRLLGEGTIEEEMYQITQEKLNLEAQVTGNEETENTDKKSVLRLLKMTLGIDLNKSQSLSPTKSPNISVNGFHG